MWYPDKLMATMYGQLQEERPTLHGGMGPLELAAKMWRLEGSMYNESVIAPGGTGMEVPLLSFGVGLLSSGHR
jgi:hypothetical protein